MFLRFFTNQQPHPPESEQEFLLQEIRVDNNTNIVNNNHSRPPIKANLKANILRLTKQIEDNQSLLMDSGLNLESLAEIEKQIQSLNIKYVNTFKRHPRLSSLGITSIALLGYTGYSIYQNYEMDLTLSHEKLNQFINTSILNYNMTCGQFYFPSSVCETLSNNTAILPKPDIYPTCTMVLSDLCRSLIHNPTSVGWKVSTIFAGGFSLFGSVLNIVNACSKKFYFFKDDRPFNILTSDEQKIIKELFTRLNKLTNDWSPANDTLICKLIDKLNETVIKIKEINDAILADQRELESYMYDTRQVNKLYYEKINSLFYPLNREANSLVGQVYSSGIIEQAKEFIALEEDYNKTYKP